MERPVPQMSDPAKRKRFLDVYKRQMMDEAYLKLFERHRNLIPVFSIEGGRRATDARRGEGAYRAAVDAMAHFRKRKILFGASITVTKTSLCHVFAVCFGYGDRLSLIHI